MRWHSCAALIMPNHPVACLVWRVQASFDAVSNRLFVGPVVQTLVFSKVPANVSGLDGCCSSAVWKLLCPMLRHCAPAGAAVGGRDLRVELHARDSLPL